MSMLVRNMFSIEIGELFMGYHNPIEKWNGWNCPMFEWEEVLKIAEWINTWSGFEILRVNINEGVVLEIEEPDDPYEIQGKKVITEDGEKILYPVGTGWWIWEAQNQPFLNSVNSNS